jgi:hypothetical protein
MVFTSTSGEPTSTAIRSTTLFAVFGSGGYWYDRQRQAPAPQARDRAFQDQLMDQLATLTGVTLFLAPQLFGRFP